MKTTSMRVKQTKAGQDYHVFGLENGKYLSVFQFDPRYSEIQVGTDIPEHVLEYDQQYDNYKLKPLPKGPQIKAAGGGYKSVQVEKAQEHKAELIQEAQARKNDAMALAAAQRDAVLMVTTFYKNEPFPTPEELKGYIVEWREWFLKEHQKRASQPF